jgi:hypothetical protein
MMSPDFGIRLYQHVERMASADATGDDPQINDTEPMGINSSFAAVAQQSAKNGLTGGRSVVMHVETPKVAMPRNISDTSRPAAEPQPLHAHQAKFNNLSNGHISHSDLGQLNSVLDWLGKSELGTDHRFIPQWPLYDTADGDLIQGFEHATPYYENSFARELLLANAPDMGAGMRTRIPPLTKYPQVDDDPCLKVSESCPQLGPLGAALEALIEGDQDWKAHMADEEVEWVMRRDRTGTVARLVMYEDEDEPQEDFILRGGYYGHFVVATIRDGGPAARAGVKSGDRLVSIDGKKDFIGLSATEVRMRMRAPATIVFLGFVGKLQAEVRLTCSDPACGLSLRDEIARGYSDNPLHICDERVFHAGSASLLFAIDEKKSGQEQPSSSSQNIHTFALQQLEANELLKKAYVHFDDKRSDAGSPTDWTKRRPPDQPSGKPPPD